MNDVNKEVAKELIGAMQYGAIGKLTKQGNKLIYEYFKELEHQKQDLTDKLEKSLQELEGIYPDADFQNGGRLVLRNILNYINKAGE